ncbi:MAG: hypothetical protein IPK26_09225 [Planctomycetes bacterium]|nr:hypothetical protein [Planctomycetota bacterium]
MTTKSQARRTFCIVVVALLFGAFLLAELTRGDADSVAPGVVGDHGETVVSIGDEVAPSTTEPSVAERTAESQSSQLRFVDAETDAPIAGLAVARPADRLATRTMNDGRLTDALVPGSYAFASESHGAGVLVLPDQHGEQDVRLAREGRALLDLQEIPAGRTLTLLLANPQSSESPIVQRRQRIALEVVASSEVSVSGSVGRWGVHCDAGAIEPEFIELSRAVPPPKWRLRLGTGRADTIAGVVRDRHGNACPGVTVALASLATKVETDAAGRFCLRRAEPSAVVNFLSVSSGGRWMPEHHAGPFPWGTADVAIVLQDHRQRWILRGEIETGQDLRVQARPQQQRRVSSREPPPEWQDLPFVSGDRHYLVGDDVRDGDWLRFCIGSRFEFRRMGDLELVEIGSIREVRGYREPPSTTLRVKVVDGAGRPIRNAAVDIVESAHGETVAAALARQVVGADEAYDPTVPRFGTSMGRCLATAMTDDSGLGEMLVARLGDRYVRATASGYSAVCKPLPRDASVVLALASTQSLSGHVAGIDEPLTVVALPLVGDARDIRYCMLDGSGAYRIEGLSAGEYELTVMLRGAGNGRRYRFGRCLIGGSDLVRDLDASTIPTGIAVGMLAGGAGARGPQSGDLIDLFQEISPGRRVSFGWFRANGQQEIFRARLPVGTYQVSWRVIRNGSVSTREASSQFGIVAGTTSTWPLTFVTRNVTVKVCSRSTGQAVENRWFRKEGGGLVRTNAQGILQLDDVTGLRVLLQPLAPVHGDLADVGPLLEVRTDADVVWLPE